MKGLGLAEFPQMVEDRFAPRGADQPTFRAFVMLRYTLIVATAYLLLVEDSFSVPPLGLTVVVSVVRLTRAAPVPARRRLLLGFGLLLGSALGGEAVQGVLVTEGLVGWPFVVTYHLEELGETLGAIALLAGAVRVLDVRREPGGVRLRLRAAAPPSSVGVGRQADDHLPDVAPA